ncbi:hypothetical protein HETIRDRAFT_437467 [Heterobasidion irregulare TC 32-1]|uniref:Uncharacterized protein n=1 Tax=Heterobasidion irregulare (strain TC 32-1) TaxID=747525 RepID=W4KNE8_HETIT|nr:uncharacterized protein HETIRDRAFT_437467 [Heterobasidion irregulare TC 32-1]ETW86581.1 hypothetical protein HETIRDRAFT_437467 [Heterobasidion irregulare TC 32-1]
METRAGRGRDTGRAPDTTTPTGKTRRDERYDTDMVRPETAIQMKKKRPRERGRGGGVKRIQQKSHEREGLEKHKEKQPSQSRPTSPKATRPRRSTEGSRSRMMLNHDTNE